MLLFCGKYTKILRMLHGSIRHGLMQVIQSKEKEWMFQAPTDAEGRLLQVDQ